MADLNILEKVVEKLNEKGYTKITLLKMTKDEIKPILSEIYEEYHSLGGLENSPKEPWFQACNEIIEEAGNQHKDESYDSEEEEGNKQKDKSYDSVEEEGNKQKDKSYDSEEEGNKQKDEIYDSVEEEGNEQKDKDGSC